MDINFYLGSEMCKYLTETTRERVVSGELDPLDSNHRIQRGVYELIMRIGRKSDAWYSCHKAEIQKFIDSKGAVQGEQIKSFFKEVFKERADKMMKLLRNNPKKFFKVWKGLRADFKAINTTASCFEDATKLVRGTVSKLRGSQPKETAAKLMSAGGGLTLLRTLLFSPISLTKAIVIWCLAPWVAPCLALSGFFVLLSIL